MPSGSKPGEKRGGSRKGIPNKATAERALIAARVVEQMQGQPGRKLAKEVLQDFMDLFAGMAAYHQPLPNGQTTAPGREPNKVEFEKWARLAVKTASDLAPYESPTFRAITVAPAPSGPKGATRKVFTFLVFDNARPQAVAKDAKEIEGKVVKRSTK